MLAFEMRLGKTRTVVEVARRLYEAGEIDQVVVVCPAPAKGVWADPEFGQVAEYSTGPIALYNYQAKPKWWLKDPAHPAWWSYEDGQDRLRWIVTSYEFLRRPERFDQLARLANERTLLVADESSYISSPSAAQTKAVYKVRQRCGRVLLLNGTPEGDNPGDIYAQFKVMDPAILGCRTWYEFRGNYAVTAAMHAGGKTFQRIVNWRNLEDLGRRTAPYILKRTTAEVHDMPTALEPVTLTAVLSTETWRLYKEMRDESVAWLNENERSAGAQAAVRVLRLAQLTSGLLGGVVAEAEFDAPGATHTREVGREKLDLLLGWLEERRSERPGFRVVVWARFRQEATRLAAAIGPDWRVECLMGGQTEEQRSRALKLLDPRTAPRGPSVLVGTVKTGGLSLEMSAADTMVYSSNDYSLMVRRQSAARILGPKQKSSAAYFDVVAEGPAGQRTVDHVVLRAIRAKLDLATLTAREWAREISGE